MPRIITSDMLDDGLELVLAIIELLWEVILMPWQVQLIKAPPINDFRSGYFPRKCFYKKDAIELKKEVEAKGGQARVEKIQK